MMTRGDFETINLQESLGSIPLTQSSESSFSRMASGKVKNELSSQELFRRIPLKLSSLQLEKLYEGLQR
jgi:hypothetical protein